MESFIFFNTFAKMLFFYGVYIDVEFFLKQFNIRQQHKM